VTTASASDDAERDQPTVSRSALGGASDELGSDFRAAVAAYVVCFGLAGRPLPFPWLRQDESSIPVLVRLETDAPVDDVYVGLRGGNELFIQAKTCVSLSRRDRGLSSAAMQMAEAVVGGHHSGSSYRLVLAVARASRSVEALFSALHRVKDPAAGAVTAAEAAAMRAWTQLTPALTTAQRKALNLVATGIVISPAQVTAAESVLAGSVVIPADVARAFRELKHVARELAQARSGLAIEEWADRLSQARIRLIPDAEGTAVAARGAQRGASRRYRAELIRDARVLDLRPLGAALAPIRHEISKFTVYSQELSRAKRDIDREVDFFVAARRRKRTLLLGLPGSGKSTALRHLAARWARDESGPLPLLVDLRTVVPLLEGRRPADALLEAALRRVRGVDRDRLRQTVMGRLKTGAVALLLDALDETRERRLEVVQAIARALPELGKDLIVVLSTRDSGYAAAATLGFDEVRLKPVSTPSYTLRRVLTALVQGRCLAQPVPPTWVEERLDWIRTTLERDRPLAETPLGGILLALLVSEVGTTDLPRGRAKTLSAVVDGIVDRWELAQRNRRLQQPAIGSFTGNSTGLVVRESFAQIGHMAFARPEASVRDVQRHVASWLGSRWGLAPGPADATAAELFAFWDEAGIFMASRASQGLRSRLQLLTEIGEARFVAALPTIEMRAAIESLAGSSTGFEAASLAAGLSGLASEYLVDWCLAQGTLEWELKAAKHLLELPEHASDRARVFQALLARVPTAASQHQWDALKSVALLGDPTESCLTSLASLRDVVAPDEYVLISALCLSRSGQVDAPDEVLRAIRTRIRRKSDRPKGRGLFIEPFDEHMGQLLADVAAACVTQNPALAESLFEASKNASTEVAMRVDAVLRDAGRPDLPRSRYSAFAASNSAIAHGLQSWSDGLSSFLTIVSELAPATDPTFVARWRLDELADFVATLRLGTSPAGDIGLDLLRAKEGVKSLVGITARLGDFDLGALAAQANVAQSLEQRDESGWSLLFYAGHRRPLEHWQRVDGIAAVKRLLPALASSAWQARVASDSLGRCPCPEAPRLIANLMPSLDPLNRLHAGNAIICIGAELDLHIAHWSGSADPFQRMLAAWWRARELDGAALTEHVTQALSDPDRSVREAALQGLRANRLPDALRDLLKTSPEALNDCGYVCAHCGTANGSVSSCSSCRIVGPDVTRWLTKLSATDGLADDEDDDE
jgi:hypothetical protein